MINALILALKADEGNPFSKVFADIVHGRTTVEEQLQRGHGSFHVACLKGDIKSALLKGTIDNTRAILRWVITLKGIKGITAEDFDDELISTIAWNEIGVSQSSERDLEMAIRRRATYKQFMADDPTSIGEVMNQYRQKIELYEHPTKGDSAPVIAVLHTHRLVGRTEAFDLDDFYEGSEYNPVFQQGKVVCFFETI